MLELFGNVVFVNKYKLLNNLFKNDTIYFVFVIWDAMMRLKVFVIFTFCSMNVFADSLLEQEYIANQKHYQAIRQNNIAERADRFKQLQSNNQKLAKKISADLLRKSLTQK